MHRQSMSEVANSRHQVQHHNQHHRYIHINYQLALCQTIYFY